MTSINSLTRRLEKLQAGAHIKHTPPNFAVIFYDMHRPDKDAWLQAETARVLQGNDHIKTLFILPEQETEEENAARYAASRERNV